MKISSIIDIIDGELLNSPSISFVYNIKINPKKIIEGDLFIAKNSKDIDEAIKNGAFAIIYDIDNIKILDKEIAWIKVKSIEESLIKLFRFKLSHLDLDVYYCDKISFDMISLFKHLNKDIKLISQKIDNSIRVIENIKPNEILFCSNKELLENIYPTYKLFNTKKYQIENLIEHSLFETSFSYKDKYYHKVKIPSLYIDQFLDVSTFLEEELDLKKIVKIEYFKPVFVDKFLNIIEFGKSNKFIITQKDVNLIEKEIQYLEEKFKYGKTIIITSHFIPNLQKEQYIFTKIKKIKEFLKSEEFNAAYIVGYDKSKIEKFLNLSSIKKTNLF